MSSADSALREILSRPHIDLRLLKVGQTIYIDSQAGSLYELSIIDPEHDLVGVSGTDPCFRGHPPITARFEGAWLTKEGGIVVPGRVIKGMRVALRFQDARFLSELVESASVHGKGWHYEAIT